MDQPTGKRHSVNGHTVAAGRLIDVHVFAVQHEVSRIEQAIEIHLVRPWTPVLHLATLEGRGARFARERLSTQMLHVDCATPVDKVHAPYASLD